MFFSYFEILFAFSDNFLYGVLLKYFLSQNNTLEPRIIGGAGIIGGWGGEDIVIIINNRSGGGNNRGGWTGLKK